MTLKNKICRDKVGLLVGFIKRKDYEEFFHTVSFLTGTGAAFYMAAVLDEISKEEQQKLKDILSQVFDKV